MVKLSCSDFVDRENLRRRVSLKLVDYGFGEIGEGYRLTFQ